MNYADQTFDKQTVELDGNAFSGCTFESCTLIYRGGTPPQLRGNTFNSCAWSFEGAAGQTLELMAALAGDNADFQRMIRERLGL